MEENEIKGRKVAIDIVKANIFAVAIMVVAAIVFCNFNVDDFSNDSQNEICKT